ncbi:MAG TPA: NB-ARC domain-containing protein [Coleofasciculaceae cyanobacterium]
MTGERSGYPLQFHRSLRRDMGDAEGLARLLQSRLIPAPTLHQLPSDIEQFVGRQAKLDDAIALLQQANLPGHNSPIILAISGRAGVGKSTLAIHIAQQVCDIFADAQLYINLRGNDNQPLELADVLSHWLRSWGVKDADMPTDGEERSRLLQRFLSEKRSLLLLDHAEDEAQVRSLLPVDGICAVLITSRKRLTNLPGATLLDLTEMSEISALELLQKFAPAGAVQAEPELGMSAVNLCSRLPLAICTFGSLLRQQPERSLQAAVEQLTEERKRLKQLHLSHAEIRANFILTYQQLDPAAARLLRLLGLLIEPSFTTVVAAVLLESELNIAREAMQQLIRFRLLESLGGDRFRFVHDLIRLLVRGQLAVEEAAETRQAARLRVCQWYLETARLMEVGLEPSSCVEMALVLSRRSRQSLPVLERTIFSGTLNWFEAERLNLLAATDWAYQAEAWPLVIALTESLVRFCDVRMHWADWEKTHRLALDAAHQLNDRSKQASILNNLANAYLRQQQWDKAKDLYEQSLSLFATLQDPLSEANTLTNLGILYAQQEQIDKTIALWHTALTKLPPDLAEHKRLKQWMQTIDKSLLQQALHYDEAHPSSRGFLQSIGQTLKRFIFE